jgi:hypothetical protein
VQRRAGELVDLVGDRDVADHGPEERDHLPEVEQAEIPVAPEGT